MSDELLLSPARIDQLIAVYRDGLLQDTLPFWINHAIDREHGGYLFGLDQDGTVIDTDKPLWTHGRFAWLLATLYATVEPNPQWLELAAHGVEFIEKHGFDDDGRMFYSVTRDGRPLRKRRYFFSETFAIMAMAAFARASGEPRFATKALDVFQRVLRYQSTPGILEPKVIPQTRAMKGLAGPMILIVTAQVLREALADPLCDQSIDRFIDEIERDFMKPEFEAVMETVLADGQFLDTFDGRLLNPGHAIEAAWFILHESQHRGGDARLLRLGRTILDWSWKWGWDEEYGGLLYYRDVRDLPSAEYWHEMKFWWPHNEAIIATLLAYHLTGDAKYVQWHRQVHDWAYAHFPDRQYGEWFGYLRRDGNVSSRLKGNMFKGPFHLPRMQWYCWKLLESMRG